MAAIITIGLYAVGQLFNMLFSNENSSDDNEDDDGDVEKNLPMDEKKELQSKINNVLKV